MVNTTKPQPPTTSSKWQLSPRLLFGITVLLCVSIAFHFALIKGEKVKKKTLGRHEAFITARLIKESLKYTFNNEYVPPGIKRQAYCFMIVNSLIHRTRYVIHSMVQWGTTGWVYWWVNWKMSMAIF